MNKEQLTWNDIKEAASSIFNIMGTNKEVEFAQNVWQNLSVLSLTSYSNNLELIKLKILFLALGDLYKDFCKVAFEIQTKFAYNDLLKKMNIDVFTLGRFYQSIIKPKENKLPDDFNSSKGLEVLIKHFRKDIYQLLLKALGSSNMLFISLWCATNLDSDQDNLDIIKIFSDIIPANSKAHSWINYGCYVILDNEKDF